MRTKWHSAWLANKSFLKSHLTLSNCPQLQELQNFWEETDIRTQLLLTSLTTDKIVNWSFVSLIKKLGMATGFISGFGGMQAYNCLVILPVNLFFKKKHSSDGIRSVQNLNTRKSSVSLQHKTAMPYHSSNYASLT